jgi:hypothetical protein
VALQGLRLGCGFCGSSGGQLTMATASVTSATL